MLGDFDRAIADYGQALALSPSYTDAYYNRGLVHEDLGRTQEAIADFRRFLELSNHPARRAAAEQKIQRLQS